MALQVTDRLHRFASLLNIPHECISNISGYRLINPGLPCLSSIYCAFSNRRAAICDKETLMQLKRVGSQPSMQGPADWFTGNVRIDMLNVATEPARHSCASVTFEPGARSAWHTHPLGQTLIVTAGCGWTQCEGESVVEIRAGDVIWCPPGHKHWHGATPTTSMTHIAIQESLDGRNVDWLEHVTDEEYFEGRRGLS